MTRNDQIAMGEDTKKKPGGINRDVVVFAFFLLLSFTLWYLNELGKESEADIRYPVEFINIPKGRLLNEDISVRINLTMRGSGYSILKLKVSRRKAPVTIDLSKVTYRRVPESETPDYYILTAGLAKSIPLQMRTGCEVTSLKPDTIFITLEREGTNPDISGK